jgi:UDPglucose 6-dehydrogenase
LEKVHQFLWVIKGKEIGLLGLAFKPFTDDIRLAPALEVIRRLRAEGARLRATDPEAMERTRSQFPDLNYSADPYDVARGADALLLLTEWPEYKKLDWARIHKEMARPLVIDARNQLDPAAMQELGFEYDSFGRPRLRAAVMPEKSR